MCLVKCLNEVLFWSFYYCVAFVFCWLLHLQNSIFLILLPLFAFFVLDFSSVSLFWPPAMVFQFFRRIESMVRLVRCFRRGSIIFIMYAFMVFHVHGWVCFCLCCPWLTLHLFILSHPKWPSNFSFSCPQNISFSSSAGNIQPSCV